MRKRLSLINTTGPAFIACVAYIDPGNFATIEELCQQVQSWEEHRNQPIGMVSWRFCMADARIKLKRLYPVQQPDAQPRGCVV
jgi:hypothetical protein